MSRPVFKIAMEIASDWQNPSPQAKAYLKGMYYLLGMDDRSADLDAATTVRFFLLYSKEWHGPVAERVKAELQEMRLRGHPNNAELLAQQSYQISSLSIDGCELCDAPLGSPEKFVDCYSQWNKRARMCMHCNYFLAKGLELGDGGLYLRRADGLWVHLHGEPKLLPSKAPEVSATGAKAGRYEPNIRLLARKIIRRAAKKCMGMVRGMLRKAG